MFHDATTRLLAYVNGGDFVGVGMPKELKWTQTKMKRTYKIKVEVLGPDKDQTKYARVLNRIIRWTDDRIEYQADLRHVKIIPKQLNIVDCNAVITPGTKTEGHAKDSDQSQSPVEEKLSADPHTLCRAQVDRANYLSPDCPDTAFSVTELAREMSAPCHGDWHRLKCMARYLEGRPGVVKRFPWQKTTCKFSNSQAEWAGDNNGRKSASGGCIMIGRHPLKDWAKTQTCVALSSGKSELYATLRAASDGLGLQSVAKGSGVELRGGAWGDATAAVGIIKRTSWARCAT